MTGIVDYGAGNLFSLKSSLAAVSEEAFVSGDPEKLLSADRLILPGVGAFPDAQKKLQKTGLSETVIQFADTGKPLLGICLGMQLLFEKSYEFGEYPGLSLIPGEVKPIREAEGWDDTLKIPHIGWNALRFQKPSRLFRDLREGDFVYFVHSYYAAGCGPYVTALTAYGAELTAAVERDNVYGCQFHPEKSGKAGLAVLKAFTELGRPMKKEDSKAFTALKSPMKEEDQ